MPEGKCRHTSKTLSTFVLQHSSGPAESVRLIRFWPDQFFLKVKAKFHFCKRQVISSVSVILGLIRLIVLNYNR